MIYTEMSVPFLLCTAVMTGVAVWKFGLSLRRLILPTVALLVLTAVFDNLIIASGIVSYTESAIAGLRVGLAPIEDFFYALAALPFVASLWCFSERSARQ